MRILKLDEMASAGRVDYYPKGKAYYQVSYEKDGETVTTTREYVNQAKLIYDEYSRKDLDGTRYPNLRLEEVTPDGTVTVLRGGEGMNEGASPYAYNNKIDSGISKYIGLCKEYLELPDDESKLEMLKQKMPPIEGMDSGALFYPVLQVKGDKTRLGKVVEDRLEHNGFSKDDYVIFNEDMDALEFYRAARQLSRAGKKFLVFDNARITGPNSKNAVKDYFLYEHKGAHLRVESEAKYPPEPVFIFIYSKESDFLKLKECVRIEYSKSSQVWAMEKQMAGIERIKKFNNVWSEEDDEEKESRKEFVKELMKYVEDELTDEEMLFFKGRTRDVAYDYWKEGRDWKAKIKETISRSMGK